MSSSPVDPARLIAYVESLQPGGGPLDHLAGAVTVAAQLEEQADALLDHFVQQARRAGASWTEIGAGIGVSKQAARKRFLPRWDGSDPIPESAMYARFTRRSRNAVGAAARIAAPARMDVGHLAAGMLAEPDGLAARIIHGAGVTDRQLYEALGLEPAPPGGDAIGTVDPTDDAREALRGSLKAALRLGHNYIGTEHLLLGILSAPGPAARTLASLGLESESAERAIAAEIARLQAD
jgi:ClpA/ClpB-like protein